MQFKFRFLDKTDTSNNVYNLEKKAYEWRQLSY